MATYKDPRDSARDTAASQPKPAQKTDRKAEAETPTPKPVITDWAAI
ncbi:hypothetical protein [Maritimibacter sp. UBA3975]|nr:hypothetical protein [Maritimibacter sp. UBA3975]|tara:strand:- start:2209 stop:2349 length:141 start_codon:yes stop_codon:yes gene_type:complete